MELTPSLCLQIASALADLNASSTAKKRSSVPYTVWITEAWRVLGWAEPSAALFWEMATMYHSLRLANQEASMLLRSVHHLIPPILSCGSTSSLGSHGTTADRTPTNASSMKKNARLHSVVSAKELPLWLVSTFLLLHCEECALQRNLSGHDERRFQQHVAVDTASKASSSTSGKNNASMDFNTLLHYPSLSPRTRLHATWRNDNRHCTAYLLRHLRKILLLTAVSHNKEAQGACLHLAAMPPTDAAIHLRSSANSKTPYYSASTQKYDANEIRRWHNDEHGNVGLQVRLTMEDLDALDFLLQPPHGGLMLRRQSDDDDDVVAPIQNHRMGEFIWSLLYEEPHPPPTATLQLGEVEREIRQLLELELALMSTNSGLEDAATRPTNEKRGKKSDATSTEVTTKAFRQLTISDRKNDHMSRGVGNETHQYKEIAYKRMRGTTVLWKPHPQCVEESPSAAASMASGDLANDTIASTGRLHDLVVSDCSDVNFYLLQPFEHVTIAACTGCTIVIGAVAGLLHVVDCERTVITAAARRVLVSNSCDVQLCLFTPCPPLLVGDIRSCQFAPYNTYYDGLREDLLSTGLAAAEPTRPSDSDVGPWLQCASNKWKQPIELSKLEVPQVPGAPPAAPVSPGADDRAMGASANDLTMQAPVLVPASEYRILFCPVVGDRREPEASPSESPYCRFLAEVLQLSPFRLPLEYERSALLKAERMKHIQQTVQKNLTPEQQVRFEEELNRGFREWLVSSGNLRQVLDLVHLEEEEEQEERHKEEDDRPRPAVKTQ
jgi:Tubulin binding cofactor C